MEIINGFSFSLQTSLFIRYSLSCSLLSPTIILQAYAAFSCKRIIVSHDLDSATPLRPYPPPVPGGFHINDIRSPN